MTAFLLANVDSFLELFERLFKQWNQIVLQFNVEARKFNQVLTQSEWSVWDVIDQGFFILFETGEFRLKPKDILLENTLWG